MRLHVAIHHNSARRLQCIQVQIQVGLKLTRNIETQHFRQRFGFPICAELGSAESAVLRNSLQND